MQTLSLVAASFTVASMSVGCAHSAAVDATDASTAGAGAASATGAIAGFAGDGHVAAQPDASATGAPSDPASLTDKLATVGRICTQMGCLDGLQIELSPATGLGAGAYTIDVEADGKRTTCELALPLPPCDKGPATVCKGELAVLVGESGCALDAAAQGFGPLELKGAPATVRVAIRVAARGGAVELGATTLRPAYRKVQPNGEGCGPVCQRATERVDLRRP